MESRCDINP